MHHVETCEPPTLNTTTVHNYVRKKYFHNVKQIPSCVEPWFISLNIHKNK